MTNVGKANFDIECPVHNTKCAYQSYSPIKNIAGNILGICEKCGYQIEISVPFGMRYRRMDDPSITLSLEEFERSRPK